ncbi:primosomal protein N' [Actinophytocola gossypii]|uniref:Probable replication restart protein PriA n=1 Tax=Actinophytocola gossypii TaxID=2812003 RepID=A0ABT2J5V6_9PSEU|nr:primosomal protein N' [Actinophytocola gossypii]MCT2583253.1 primosomal protein N' [Actinophytocola gossypii]
MSGARKGEPTPAASAPVARVVVDVPLAHLDRPFDYLVPSTLDDDAVPGCRVRVRFAGKQVDGFLLSRTDSTDFGGRLGYLTKVVSPEPVLAPEIATLARTVADRYAGSMIDVLRLAIPPRHARVEAEAPPEPAPPPPAPAADGWRRYPRGPAFLDAVRAGRQAHAVWQALPGENWPARLAELAATAAAGDRGAVLVVPDYRDVARLHAACVAVAGEDAVVALSADAGPAKRYRRWLSVLRGRARIVVGTRASVFAPVHRPGVFVVWDDGDDLHADPHAPYPHVRDVLIQRAHAAGASVVVAGFARTAEAQLLVDSGWAPEIVAARDELRAAAPRVVALGETDVQLARDPAARAARIPSVAFDAARAAIRDGRPVLVQVPRGGYVPALACQQCRGPARCRRCAGPLGLPAGGQAGAPTCRWCGVPDTAFRCGTCGSRRLRAIVVGAKRTAEELGRAFADVPVLGSGAREVLAEVAARPALVVATPGAEPVAEGGYGAALLLDGWALLGRADLRASEEALRRWMLAAALVRSHRDGGRVVVLAESVLAPVQALVRWNPVWHARQELAARTELGFPPSVRMASVDGEAKALATFLDELELPPTGEILGPVPLGPDERERALVRTTRAEGRALAAALATAQHVRTARKEPDPIRVRLDPLELI